MKEIPRLITLTLKALTNFAFSFSSSRRVSLRKDSTIFTPFVSVTNFFRSSIIGKSYIPFIIPTINFEWILFVTFWKQLWVVCFAKITSYQCCQPITDSLTQEIINLIEVVNFYIRTFYMCSSCKKRID